MSDNNLNDPFATPGPGAQQWQGTPVPLQPTMPPMQPGNIVPPSTYIQPPPRYIPPPTVPQNPAYGAVAYPPPPPAGYMYAPTYNSANTSKNWMGITSLVLSLATIIVGFTFIPGVILGHMGLAAAKRGEANNKGIALAGALVGWFFVGITLLFIGIMIIAIAADNSTY